MESKIIINVAFNWTKPGSKRVLQLPNWAVDAGFVKTIPVGLAGRKQYEERTGSPAVGT